MRSRLLNTRILVLVVIVLAGVTLYLGGEVSRLRSWRDDERKAAASEVADQWLTAAMFLDKPQEWAAEKADRVEQLARFTWFTFHAGLVSFSSYWRTMDDRAFYTECMGQILGDYELVLIQIPFNRDAQDHVKAEDLTRLQAVAADLKGLADVFRLEVLDRSDARELEARFQQFQSKAQLEDARQCPERSSR